MIEKTLELDIEVSEEDLEHYSKCYGAIGVTGYKNIITIYYDQPISNNELTSLARAIKQQLQQGIRVINTELEQEMPLTTITRKLQEHNNY